MARALLDRINALPATYSQHKLVLGALANEQGIRTKAQLCRALKTLRATYDEQLKTMRPQLRHTRMHKHLTQCRTLTQKCHDLARNRL